MGTTVKHTHTISRQLAGGLGLVTAALGVVGLSGWIVDQPLLRGMASGYGSMKANLAVGLIAAGLAMFAYTAMPLRSVTGQILRRGGGTLAMLIGLLTLLQHWTGADLGIDQLIARDPWTTADLHPGRMPRAGAAGLLLYGLASLFTPRKARWSFWTGFTFTAIGFWASLFVFVAFLFNAHALEAFASFARATPMTAVAFLALFIGVMLATPDRGWARIVMTDKLGGVMARRLLPLITVLPLGILWLAHEGAERGYYPDRLGEYVGAVLLLIVLTTVVLVSCGRLNVLDAQRRTVEEGRREAQAAALRLREMADTDGLTELSNRRHFLEVAQDKIARAASFDSLLSLLMVDIDHFKRINDTYGHASGDQALRLLAATLRESTRKADCVARLGGEEFAILLPGASAATAHEIAERICKHVATLAILDGAGRQFGFTVSIGVTSMDESDTKPEHLLARADAALYRAKRGGRNRVEIEGEGRRAAA